MRQFAELAITEWKLDAILYHRYGGIAIRAPEIKFRPVPWEAYQRLLADLEQQEVLRIFDHSSPIFPKLTKNDQPLQMAAPDINFQTPWWEKVSELDHSETFAAKWKDFDPLKIPTPDPKREKPVARIFNDYIYKTDLGTNSQENGNAADEKLSSLIIPQLTERLAEEEKITAKPDEIKKLKQYLKNADKGMPDNPLTGVLDDPLPNPRYERLTKILTALPSATMTLLPFEKLPDESKQRLGLKFMGGDFRTSKFATELYSGMVIEWKLGRLLYKRYGGTVIFQQSNPTEPVGAYRKFLEQMEREKAFEIFDTEVRTAFFAYYVREDHPMKSDAKGVNFEKPWWEEDVQGE